MRKTKPYKKTETVLKGIANRSRNDERLKFLMPLFCKKRLEECYYELRKDAAPGIDRKSWVDYGSELDTNIGNLILKMKGMAYKPAPVRKVLIPKDGSKGAFRPLGISSIEDKIVQLMVAKILGAIYEPVFLEFSHGFRPGRGCLTAIKQTHQFLFMNRTKMAIDLDIQNFFGSVNHKTLISFLKEKIEDPTFLRYIVRLLKAGILEKGCFKITDEGTAQGSICSPILSNIFLHYVFVNGHQKLKKNGHRKSHSQI